MAIRDKITELVKPIIESLGFELWGCELVGEGSNKILCVYIDSTNGVDIDDCSEVSDRINGILDVEGPIQGSYSLEVSSPGMDRKLFTIEHYARFIGKAVKLKLSQALNNRRNYKGIIDSIAGDIIHLKIDHDEIILIDIKNIDKARLVPDF